MIPILYDLIETEFTNNGIARLSDCISCLVTEERNGEYEVEFTYPITGAHYKDIVEGRIICVDHDETGDIQPFEIYGHTAPIDGIVTFYAHHISYRLTNTILKPLTASSATAAFLKFETEILTPQQFSFWTDVSRAGTFKLDHPASVRSMLGGTEGSILDVYGGEYEFDKFTVKLHGARGANNNVQIRYGKNLTELTQDYDTSTLYSSILPYWLNSETGEVIYGNPVTRHTGIPYTRPWTNENNVNITDEDLENIVWTYYRTQTVAMDFSEKYEKQPTVEQLEAAAASYLAANTPWVPKENIEVDFVALWQTEEYKDIAPLERVRLCDTVTIIYTALGVNATAKVIKVVWNALTNKYDKIELGEARTSFADTIIQSTEEIIKELPTKTMMDQAIDHATQLITGGLGGHVVFGYDGDSKPTEIFIMDTDDANTAVNVLRMNINGIGFSHNGVGGPFETAWTLDGAFVANFITSGILNANLIKTGTISAADGSSYWDLDGSVLRFFDNSFNSFVELDEGFIRFGHGDSEFGRITRMIQGDASEDLLAIWGPTKDTRITLKDALGLYSEKNLAIDTGNDINIWALGHLYASISDYLWLTGITNVTLDASGTIQLNAGSDSFISARDTDSYQYIDMNSGGNTYIRVDGKDDYIRLQATDLTINGYYGYTGSVTVDGQTFSIHNGLITSVS